MGLLTFILTVQRFSGAIAGLTEVFLWKNVRQTPECYS